MTRKEGPVEIEITRASRLRVPDSSEVDFGRLRRERLERLQTTMRDHGIAACLLFLPANIRYATGTSHMDIYAGTIAVRYCIVPAEGGPILFDDDLVGGRPVEMVDDLRHARFWVFNGERSESIARSVAEELRSVLTELGVNQESIAVDRLDALGFLALQAAGIRIVDAARVTHAAREIKTPEEVKLLIINGAIGDAMLADFEAAIRPGIREYELLAVLTESLIRRHGEVIFTRLVASGRNTNPWGSEAHDKMVMPGDLVAVDTDAQGYEGYLIDLSRTFVCGGVPIQGQIELYKVAHECVLGMRDVARAGVSYREFAETAPKLPDRFRQQRYHVLVHGAGLEDEGPLIYHADEPEKNPTDVYLRENMAINLECYVGEVGGAYGVKLEDPVLITSAGAELLSTYPYDARLLGL